MSLTNFRLDDVSADHTEIYDRSEKDLVFTSKVRKLITEKELSNRKSVFLHLTSCIKKILEERPNNALDVFEDISKNVSLGKTKNAGEGYDLSIDNGLAEIQRELFKKGEGDEEEAVIEEDVETPLPNMMLHAYFYEQAAIGFNREELHRIWLAMKVLVNTQPVEHARFWGKIFGLHQNYYVAEVEFREGEQIDEEEEENDAVEEDRPESRDNDDEEVEDLPPKSQWKPSPSIPSEEFRTGANKKIYFVCNEPGKPWIRLPNVTPAQISSARKIKKIFSGYLEAEVKCFPPFPGLEMNLLRAQIARISAGTQISPIGFYTFDNEDEEEEAAEEDGGGHDSYIENPDYVAPKVRELLDGSLVSWVHHTQHILPQGRCVWWRPNGRKDDEIDDAEEEDDGEGREDEEAALVPEKGPALLTPISEDVSLGGIEPWSVRLSSGAIPEYAVVTVSSNLWPGAHAFAFRKHFQNIYIGWACKNQGPYAPFPTAAVMHEFVDDKSVTEAADPSPEEEQALKAAHGTTNDEEHDEEQEEEEDNN